MDHAYYSSKQDQILLYIRGKGRVSKSQIIKGITTSIDLILYKDKVILIAPIRAAADNISGNTYYTSLGISINKSRETNISPRVRRL